MLNRRRNRPDPFEQAAERIQAGLEPFEPLPPSLLRINRSRLAFYFLLVLIAVAVWRDGLGRPAPEADGTCERPAFALDRVEVNQDGVIKWSVAGPTGSTVVITADASTSESGRLLGPIVLKDCKASGRFGVPLPDGDHVLRVFLLDPDGTTQELGMRTLVVNEAR